MRAQSRPVQSKSDDKGPVGASGGCGGCPPSYRALLDRGAAQQDDGICAARPAGAFSSDRRHVGSNRRRRRRARSNFSWASCSMGICVLGVPVSVAPVKWLIRMTKDHGRRPSCRAFLALLSCAPPRPIKVARLPPSHEKSSRAKAGTYVQLATLPPCPPPRQPIHPGAPTP